MSQNKSDRLDKKIKSLTDEIVQLQRKRSEILDERIIDELPMRVIDDDGKEVKIAREQVAECIRRFFKAISLGTPACDGPGCAGYHGMEYLDLYIRKECGIEIYSPALYNIWDLVHECYECAACNRQWPTAQFNIPDGACDEETKSFWDYVESQENDREKWIKQFLDANPDIRVPSKKQPTSE